MADERAKKIKLMLFDVDGVMTDGTIFLFPAPGGGAGHGTNEHRERMADAGGFGFASSTMIEAKGFNAHDGTGFSLARLGGLKTGIITKREGDAIVADVADFFCAQSGFLQDLAKGHGLVVLSLVDMLDFQVAAA